MKYFPLLIVFFLFAGIVFGYLGFTSINGSETLNKNILSSSSMSTGEIIKAYEGILSVFRAPSYFILCIGCIICAIVSALAMRVNDIYCLLKDEQEYRIASNQPQLASELPPDSPRPVRRRVRTTGHWEDDD